LCSSQGKTRRREPAGSERDIVYRLSANRATCAARGSPLRLNRNKKESRERDPFA